MIADLLRDLRLRRIERRIIAQHLRVHFQSIADVTLDEQPIIAALSVSDRERISMLLQRDCARLRALDPFHLVNRVVELTAVMAGSVALLLCSVYVMQSAERHARARTDFLFAAHENVSPEVQLRALNASLANDAAMFCRQSGLVLGRAEWSVMDSHAVFVRCSSANSDVTAHLSQSLLEAFSLTPQVTPPTIYPPSCKLQMQGVPVGPPI